MNPKTLSEHVKEFFAQHRIASVFIILAVVYLGYRGYAAVRGDTTSVQYITSPVTKGTLVVSVSGTGQVVISSQVDVKPKASGQVLSVNIKNGQQVKTGQVLGQLDAKTAYRSVRDAQLNLESANLSLAKLEKSADADALLQAQGSLQTAQDNLKKLKFSQSIDYDTAKNNEQKAKDAITKGYDDAFNAVSNTYVNLPTIMTKLNDVLYSYEIGTADASLGRDMWNKSAYINSLNSLDVNTFTVYVTSAENDYKDAKTKYDADFASYKAATRYSDQSTIEALLSQTLDAVKSVSQATKSESNLLDEWTNLRTLRSQSIFSKVKDYQASLATYSGQANSHLTTLLNSQQTLKDNTQSLVDAQNTLKQKDQNNPLDITSADLSVREKQAALEKLQRGADSLDLQTQKLQVTMKQNAVAAAQETLSDYTITAPFDGVIAKVGLIKGDTVSSGTVAATLITKQELSQISLNEVDASKIKVGDKATMTFDAVDSLTISGSVVEIDALGTVTQGVVTYNAKISLDTQDARVKPGMSVSASIITDVHADVLLAPNAAVKTQGGASYVEMLDSAGAPQQIAVETGLSNDTSTEILSGIKEGDEVITRTVTAVKMAAAGASTSSAFGGAIRVPGVGGAGGGGARAGGGGGGRGG